MEGVHHVLELYRVLHRFLDFAVEVRRANENQRIGLVPADNGDDNAGVFLDVFPGAVSIGLIANLENHVRDIRIFLRHHVEKRDGLGQVLVGVVVGEDMPVHHHVHVVCDGVLHALAQYFQVLFAVAVHVIVGIHGEADQVRIPFRTQLVEQFIVHVLRVPRETVRAGALEYGEIPVRIAENRPVYVQLPVDGWPCYGALGCCENREGEH